MDFAITKPNLAEILKLTLVTQREANSIRTSFKVSSAKQLETTSIKQRVVENLELSVIQKLEVDFAIVKPNLVEIPKPILVMQLVANSIRINCELFFVKQLEVAQRVVNVVHNAVVYIHYMDFNVYVMDVDQMLNLFTKRKSLIMGDIHKHFSSIILLNT